MTIIRMLPTIKRKLETSIQKTGKNCKSKVTSANSVLVLAVITGCFGYGFFIFTSEISIFSAQVDLFLSFIETGLLGAMLRPIILKEGVKE